jgi:hypothetical protein
MKTSLFTLILLLFLHSTAFPGKKTTPGTSTPAPAFWPQDSTVTVYFVRGLFTVEQQQILRRTLETWATAEARSTVRFLYAGETTGLIDCVGCLTLTRQEFHAKSQKRNAAFNRLRSDQTGRLISAWIGFDSSIRDSQKLRSLLIQVLGGERLPRDGARNSEMTAGRR